MNNFRIMLLIFISFLTSCNLSNSQTPPLFNVNTFDGEYRELALEINKDNKENIIKLIKDKHLDVNHKDAKYGISLLRWAMANRKYYSFKQLLELRANPNQMDSINEPVPVITLAAKIVDTFSYLNLILRYGGNPNIVSKKQKTNQYTEATPLCAAASTSLENVKMLIDEGAEINFCPSAGLSPLTTALIANKIDIAKYLIMEKKSDINKVFTIGIHNDTTKIAELLRFNIFPLGSLEYKLKMEIVKYLNERGIDYYQTPIPQYLYGRYSKEFLEKY